jgi:hypothetical protein
VPGDHAAAHYRLPRARRRDEDPEFVGGDGVHRGQLVTSVTVASNGHMPEKEVA